MLEFPEPKEQATTSTRVRHEPNLKLRRERELKGWAQADLAEKIGAQPNLITRWEKGYSFPSPYYRQKLCELLGKTAEELGLLKETQANPEEEVLPVQPTEQQPATPIPRRSVIIGVIGGVVAGGVLAGGIASLAWWQTLSHPVTTPAPRPKPSSLLYTYQTHPPSSINDLKWSPPRGAFIASANGDRTIQILEAMTDQALLTYRGHKGLVNSVSWSPDGSRVASGSQDRTVQVWNPSNGAPLLTYSRHTDTVLCVAWSPDGTRIASSSKDSAVHVWDAPNGNLITKYTGHSHRVWSVTWSPDSQSIASGGEDGTIQVWEAATGRKSDTFSYKGNPNSTIWELAWSPDGSRIASANEDTTIQIWDALTGGLMLTCRGHTDSVQTVKWSPDGKLLASGSRDKTVRIWNALTGTQNRIYTSHKDVVYTVGWSPDGKFLASGSNDTTIEVHREP